MSKTKPVRIHDRLVWVWDNSHDVVLASLVEVAGPDADDQVLHDWRVWASIADLGFRYPTGDWPDADQLVALLELARDRIEEHGAVEAADLTSWSVLEGKLVSGGFLRQPLPAAAVIEVVDAFQDLALGTYDPDPPGGAWLLGAPGGRTTVGMRPNPSN